MRCVIQSLDMLGLEIILEGGEPHERKHAAAIMPVRARGNLLLCTLLLGNTLVNGRPLPPILPTTWAIFQRSCSVRFAHT